MGSRVSPRSGGLLTLSRDACSCSEIGGKVERAIVVYPPRGSLDGALACDCLLVFAKQKQLDASGPLRATPHIARCSSARATKQDLQKLEVRLELPIAEPK